MALASPDERFHQIIATGEETVVGAARQNGAHVYRITRDGDGTVPRDLAEMGNVPRYYCKGAHGWLCNRSDVIAATIDLIGTGKTQALPQTVRADTRETVAIDALSTDMAAAAQSTLPPTQETDFAGAFLSSRADVDPTGTATTGAASPSRMAYSSDVVKAASARWQASDPEREVVMRSQLEAQPLSAETPARLNAYARRLITQVDAAKGNGQAHKISRELENALGYLDTLEGTDLPPAAPATALLERVIGEAEEFLSVMFVKRAVVASRAVGRIVSATTLRGFGTGFLIAPGILITNHHVLSNARSAEGAAVQFSYELEIDSREMPGHTFALEPGRLFHADERLDMAIVAVAPVSADGRALDEFGFLPLVGVEGKIRKGQPVNIIQHPLAGRKQVVFRESVLTALPTDVDHVAHYTGDTQPGSSGSPVFSDRWEVVALHHSGVPDQTANGDYITMDGGIWNATADPQMRTVKWVANEGIRVSRIVAHLKTLPALLSRSGQPGAALVDNLLGVCRQAAVDGLFSVPAPLLPPAREHMDQPQPPDIVAAQVHNPRPAQMGATLTVPLRISFNIG